MTDAVVVFYLARHGTTTLNESNCFRGKIDAPLDARGFQDAAKLANLFKDINFGSMYVSPRKRATQTADAIARVKGVEYEEVPALAALNVGKFSGQPKSPENVKEIEKYLNDPDVPIPGGESLNGFRRRVRPVFKYAVNEWYETGLPPLLTIHSSIIHEAGQAFNEDHHSARVEPGGVAAVFLKDGELHAEPIFKPWKRQPGQSKADTIS